MGGYRIQKYENNEIDILIKGEEESLFNMEMHDYQDFEKCIILRNRELVKMYCFDKKEQSVLMETTRDEELKDYLQKNYSIKEIKWELIYD